MLSFTFLLYLFIFITTTLLAHKSQKICRNRFIFEYKWLVWAFFIHWLFCAFTKIGTDHEQYIYIISYDASVRYDMGLEVGFNGLCMILYSITHNAEICIFILKTLSLLIVYCGFFLLRKHVQLGLCVLGYNVTTYLIGYYLLAMHLAVALVFLSGALMMRNYRPILALAFAVVGMTIHTSCMTMVVCMGCIYALNKFKIKMNITSFFVILIITFVVLANVYVMFQYAISNMDMLTAYEQYGEARDRQGSGLFNYFLYGIFILYVISVFRSDMKPFEKNAIMFYFVFSLMFAILGYSLGISRLNFYSIVFISIAVPYYFYQVKYENLKVKPVLTNKPLMLIWCIYLSYRLVNTLMSYTSELSGSGLNRYEFFNPLGL